MRLPLFLASFVFFTVSASAQTELHLSHPDLDFNEGAVYAINFPEELWQLTGENEVKLNNGPIVWELLPVNLITEDFKLRAGSAELFTTSNVQTYSGTLYNGTETYPVSMNITEEGVEATLLKEGKSWRIDPADDDKHIGLLYLPESTESLPLCALKDIDRESIAAKSKNDEYYCFQLKLAIAVDYSAVDSLGGVKKTYEYFIRLLNLTQPLFKQVEIRFQLSEMFLVSQPGTSPFIISGTAAALNSFKNWANGRGFTNPFDIATLWYNKRGNEGGQATLRSACRPELDRYHVADIFNSNLNAWMTQLWAHEIGHNLGANHDTHPGYIMYATSTTNIPPPANSFSQFSLERIYPNNIHNDDAESQAALKMLQEMLVADQNHAF